MSAFEVVGPAASTIIFDQILGGDAASFDIQSIPQTYRHLYGVYRLRGAASSGSVSALMRLNNDSGGNYQRVNLAGSGAASQTSGLLGTVSGDTATANNVGAGTVWLEDYASATWFKVFHALCAFWNEGVTSGYSGEATMWDNDDPVTRVTILPSSGNWKAGSRFTLYGL